LRAGQLLSAVATFAKPLKYDFEFPSSTIIRCLKRYLARGIDQVLLTAPRPRRPSAHSLTAAGWVNPATPKARAAGLKRPLRSMTINADEDTPATHRTPLDRT
jgi:hypothetical protein